ncbi:MAG: DinB family protein [Planctomycetota bacterium]
MDHRGLRPAQDRPDDRDRPAEFAAEAGPTPAELADRLTTAVSDAAETVRSLNKDHLLAPRTIQKFPVTGLGAVLHATAHLEGHAQETVFATRLILGQAYRFKDHY